MTLMLMLATSAQAQIWIMDGDEGGNMRTETTDFNGDLSNVIIHGSPDDQTNYVPLGSGILLLTAMEGAYLVCKRKNLRDAK